MAEPDSTRRTFLKHAGAGAVAVGLAGCSTQQPTETPSPTSSPTSSPDQGTPTPTPQPETREEYLQLANKVLHDKAAWIYLNQQFSVYGKSTDVEWTARVDETIDAYAITPTSGDSVTITQSQMDSGLDPQDHRETPTDNIVQQAYEGLLERDREGATVERLATGYERVEDGVVKFTLRDGVTFHSGDDFTKEDAAYSVNRIVNNDVGGLASSQADQLAGVTGASPVDGENAIEVQSDGLNPIVFALFSSYCDVMNKSWVESHEKAYWNSNMDGTGPFQLESYEADVKVVLTRYEDYWDDPAPARQVTIQAAGESSTRVNQLLGGETDVIVNVPPQDVSRVQNSGDAAIEAVPSTRVIFNAMRNDIEPFSSQQFRQAMNYAIDLDGIIENVLSGFAAATGQPTLEGFTGYNPDVEPYPQDVAKAESLVEESGHAGAEITLHTPVGRYLKDLEIAQAVANQIDQLSNVSCSVKQRDFGKLAGELTSGNIKDSPHFYLIGWGNTTFDATQTIIPLLTSDGLLTSFQDEEVDTLIEKADQAAGN